MCVNMYGEAYVRMFFKYDYVIDQTVMCALAEYVYIYTENYPRS